MTEHSNGKPALRTVVEFPPGLVGMWRHFVARNQGLLSFQLTFEQSETITYAGTADVQELIILDGQIQVFIELLELPVDKQREGIKAAPVLDFYRGESVPIVSTIEVSGISVRCFYRAVGSTTIAFLCEQLLQQLDFGPKPGSFEAVQKELRKQFFVRSLQALASNRLLSYQNHLLMQDTFQNNAQLRLERTPLVERNQELEAENLQQAEDLRQAQRARHDLLHLLLEGTPAVDANQTTGGATVDELFDRLHAQPEVKHVDATSSDVVDIETPLATQPDNSLEVDVPTPRVNVTESARDDVDLNAPRNRTYRPTTPFGIKAFVAPPAPTNVQKDPFRDPDYPRVNIPSNLNADPLQTLAPANLLDEVDPDDGTSPVPLPSGFPPVYPPELWDASALPESSEHMGVDSQAPTGVFVASQGESDVEEIPVIISDGDISDDEDPAADVVSERDIQSIPCAALQDTSTQNRTGDTLPIPSHVDDMGDMVNQIRTAQIEDSPDDVVESVRSLTARGTIVDPVPASAIFGTPQHKPLPMVSVRRGEEPKK